VRYFAVAAAALLLASCGDAPGNGATHDGAAPGDLSLPADASQPAGPDLSSAPDLAIKICTQATRCLDATTLERCENGQSTQTTCVAPQVCRATAGGEFGCEVDPNAPKVVSGKVRYEDRPALPPGTLGDVRQVPVRGASISVIGDEGSAVLATGRTADDGGFSLSYTATPGKMVHLLVATTSDLATRPLQVTRLNKSVHGFGGASFAASAEHTVDVLVTQASHEAEAFNVFDMMVTGIDAVRSRMGATTIQPLTAFWEPGSTDGTYYNSALNLLGSADDDDGYDDAVILHEFGHYVEDIYGHSDSPGGSHDGTATDPRLAWSEGWATYFSSAARDNAFYVDTNAGGGFSEDLENDVATAKAASPMTQDVPEGMISQILWDVGDAPANDDDARSGSERHTDVMKVQVKYLHPGVSKVRGVAGIDLVDWLDGWFNQQGTSTCAALRSIVKTHNFPYDFKSPQAICP
jgi:hypothetical protein